jgi:hypothetical protein
VPNTPAMALGLTAGELLGAALAVAPADPTTTAPERRKRFWVAGHDMGGKKCAPRPLSFRNKMINFTIAAKMVSFLP